MLTQKDRGGLIRRPRGGRGERRMELLRRRRGGRGERRVERAESRSIEWERQWFGLSSLGGAKERDTIRDGR